MRAIVAIGGGEMHLGQTRPIDEYIVSLSDRLSPRLLFLPTASHDSPAYIRTVAEAFGALGCQVDTLCLWDSDAPEESLRRRILESDIIYVGGGDTDAMLRLWRARGVDSALQEAWEKGVVLSGLSAGAICWFHRGLTDREVEGHAQPAWCDGLGLIPYCVGPHYDEPFWTAFDAFMAGADRPGIALENNVALAVVDGRMTVLRAQPERRAWVLYPQAGGICKRPYEGGFL